MKTELEVWATKVINWFESSAAIHLEAAKDTRFKSLSDARTFDANNYLAMAREGRKALANKEKQTGIQL